MAQSSDPAEGAAEAPLEAAIKRLERALAVLDGRVKELSGRAEGSSGGLFDFDRSKLASELDAARARERMLEDAGHAAADALGRAIAQVRQVLDAAEEA